MDLQSMLYKMMPEALYKGAAQSRVTRTPIIQRDLPNRMEGEYINPSVGYGNSTPVDMLKLLAGHMNPFSNFIRQSPNAQPDVIRHEDIHAALAPVADKLAGLTLGPQSSTVNHMLRATRNVDAGVETEAPAYMGAYKESETMVPPLIREMWVRDFQNGLNQVNPNVARQYDRLAHPNAFQTASAGENGGAQ